VIRETQEGYRAAEGIYDHASENTLPEDSTAVQAEQAVPMIG